MIPKVNTYYIASDSGEYNRVLYLTSVRKIKDERSFPREYEIEGILLFGFGHGYINWWEEEADTNQGDINDLECGYGNIRSIKPNMIIKKLFKDISI